MSEKYREQEELKNLYFREWLKKNDIDASEKTIESFDELFKMKNNVMIVPKMTDESFNDFSKQWESAKTQCEALNHVSESNLRNRVNLEYFLHSNIFKRIWIAIKGEL